MEKIKLENKYVIGCLVMFYEIEMLPEYITSIVNMIQYVDNPENVTIHLCFNLQEYLEEIDLDKISKSELFRKFDGTIKILYDIGVNVIVDVKDNTDDFHNIAQYRRDLNYHWCEKVDYVIWGETDSLFPEYGLVIIEEIDEYAKDMAVYRPIITFAYRKNWDSSWDVLTHPLFVNVDYQDNREWLLNNEASSKSYMTLERMNEINRLATELHVEIINTPKFDGSCLVISSNLIKAGVNIPHAMTHCAEDTSFAEMAKIMMGKSYVQYIAKNILRVHNRRHPKKRMYIKGENNPHGFTGKDKGDWWDVLETTSKYNLSILRNNQQKFVSLDDVLKRISEIKQK
jgi:hypothetical protein